MSPENGPQVEAVEEGGKRMLRITVADDILGKKLQTDADILALAAAVIPSAETKDIAGLFKVTLNPDGFFKEAHVKLRPVEFATDGVYLCGMAHYDSNRGATFTSLLYFRADYIFYTCGMPEIATPK